MRKHTWAYARQLLHAFAEAGVPAAQEFQPLIGPNGPVAWTKVAEVDRRQPFSQDTLTTECSSPRRISHEPPADLAPPAPANGITVPKEPTPQSTGVGV
jgi:hypothetical protein